MCVFQRLLDAFVCLFQHQSPWWVRALNTKAISLIIPPGSAAPSSACWEMKHGDEKFPLCCFILIWRTALFKVCGWMPPCSQCQQSLLPLGILRFPNLFIQEQSTGLDLNNNFGSFSCCHIWLYAAESLFLLNYSATCISLSKLLFFVFFLFPKLMISPWNYCLLMALIWKWIILWNKSAHKWSHNFND